MHFTYDSEIQLPGTLGVGSGVEQHRSEPRQPIRANEISSLSPSSSGLQACCSDEMVIRPFGDAACLTAILREWRYNESGQAAARRDAGSGHDDAHRSDVDKPVLLASSGLSEGASARYSYGTQLFPPALYSTPAGPS